MSDKCPSNSTAKKLYANLQIEDFEIQVATRFEMTSTASSPEIVPHILILANQQILSK